MNEEKKECVICLQALILGKEENANAIAILGCKCVFHSNCIKEWSQVESKCPICRAEMQKIGDQPVPQKKQSVGSEYLADYFPPETKGREDEFSAPRIPAEFFLDLDDFMMAAQLQMFQCPVTSERQTWRYEIQR